MRYKYQDIIDDMTLEEKAHLITGKNMWETFDIERLHIPSMFMSDGPHGIRKQEGADLNNVEFINGAPATCFPPSATTANSWDEELAEEVGRALGEEAIDLNVNMLLGPGLNIKRSPLCGRNFEYFSEDPYLSGKMAAGYVRGIQSQGVASCIKHFAANNQEFQRMCNNSVVDERTLREIYTTGFEIAVKEGAPLAIMACYNQVNGTYGFENKHLLTDILRDEWGFKGAVISDWGASNEIVETIKAGGNLEMPGCGDVTAKEITDAVDEDRLDEKLLDKRISELLDVILWANQYKELSASSNGGDYDEHAKVAEKAARESIVLLKNEQNILPIKKETRVAIIGDLADRPRFQGGGSSIVTPINRVESVVSKIRDYDINNIGYAAGYELGGDINISKEEEAVKLASEADTVLLFVGLDDYTESEGFDRENLNLPENQVSLAEKIVSANDNVVLVLAGGSPFIVPCVAKVKGIVHGYLYGQEGAGAIIDVITGAHNPCGKLSETYPLSLEDVPCNQYFPGRGKNVLYKEGLYVGYRYYDTVGKAVRFPFGFGLSYTTFVYANIEADKTKVSFDIKNTGEVAGAEIAQVYIGREQGSIYRPKKELKGFKKVYLEPGETKRVEIELDEYAFRYYDVIKDKWSIEQGTYYIYVASSVNDVRLKKCVEIGQTNESTPSYFRGDIENVSDEEFIKLYGGDIKEPEADGIIRRNDSVSALANSKSFVGRMIVKYLNRRLKNSKTDLKKKADTSGALDMPLRGIGKLTGGKMNAKMVDSIVDIANGGGLKSWKELYDEKKRLDDKDSGK